MTRVTYEAEYGETEVHECDTANADEEGNFCVCLRDDGDDLYKTRIPLSRVVRINERIE